MKRAAAEIEQTTEPQEGEEEEEVEENYFKKKQKSDSKEEEEEKKTIFADQLKEVVIKKFPDASETTYNAEKFVFTFKLSGTVHTLFLTNGFLKWLGYGDLEDNTKRENVLEEMISSIRQQEEGPKFDQIKDLIYPKILAGVTRTVLRCQIMMSEGSEVSLDGGDLSSRCLQLRLIVVDGCPQLNAPADELESREIAEHLGMDLIYNTPTEFIQLKKSDLTRWGKSYDQLQMYELALSNLRKEKIRWRKLARGVFSASAGDAYEAGTLMAMGDLFLALEISGNPVVLPITRSLIIVTGSEDQQGLETMVEISSNYITSNEFFSGIPLVYQPDRNNSNHSWQVYKAQPSQSTEDLKYLEQAVTFHYWYSQQEEYLQKISLQSVQLLPFQVDDESFESSTVWTQKAGKPVLIPRANQVQFETEEDKSEEEVPNAFIIPSEPLRLDVSFDHTNTTLGLKRAPGFEPPLYFSSSFPSGQLMQRLKSLGTQH
ncbi:hypothetical protein PROFUN_15238 [Planoprotostelium fungivorum]|uniref:Uncharacterized protein n=1 Tax=Planoprotostelium fungivorum TaxID=1890364 RepID=A0A2P6MXI3_9EUKA|nr:hypothetical protein PROFUN_15230 [Planoprotostelium fungivorum]PRP76415.1 hypothetical protein PROFUN_15238 [Planoprotostelium fungivorum]